MNDPGMSGMTACSNYKSLCGVSGSMVKECTSSGPIPNVLQTATTVADIQAMCSAMPMDGCSGCTSSSQCPDPLATISTICLSMEMTGCSDWQSMCNSISMQGQSDAFEFVCGGSSGAVNTEPIMRMYFHQSTEDFVLFHAWVPRNSWQYALTFFAIILMGVLVTFLKVCRLYLDEVKKQKEAEAELLAVPLLASPSDSPPKKIVHPKFFRAILPGRKQLRENLVRACFTLAIVTLDFLLMLVAMTFNVGLFVAVVLGYGVGTILFGHGLLFVEADLVNCCTK